MIMSGNTLLNNLLSDIRLVESLYAEDRIVEAYFLFQNIVQYIPTVDADVREKVEKVLHASKNYKGVQDGGNEIMELLKMLTDKDVWNSWNSGMGLHQDVSLFTHRDESKGQYFFKIEGNLRCSMKESIVAILENELYGSWLPLCTRSETLSTPGNYHRVIRTDFDFVLLQKSAVCKVRGDILPDGSALLSLFPVKEDEKDNIFLVGGKPNSRMDLSGIILLKPEEITETIKGSTFASLMSTREHTKIISGSEYSNMENIHLDTHKQAHHGINPMLTTSPVSPKHSTTVQNIVPTIKFQAIFKADLRIEFIPDWIFNLGVRSAISMLIPMLEHQAELFREGNLYHQHTLDHSNIYNIIDSRLREYAKKKK